MPRKNSPGSARFPALLNDVKQRIQEAQSRAVLAVNRELVRLYWDIGRLIDARQGKEGWGAAVIPRLSRELRNELPEVKGFSERNIKSMLAFFREYPDQLAIVQQPAAFSEAASSTSSQDSALAPVRQAAAQPKSLALWAIPWYHHIVLMEKVKDLPTRHWYMRQTLANGWSRSILLTMIRSSAHRRQGRATTNFDRLLPSPQSDLARQSLKDPYIFDFLTLEEPFHERELEVGLLRHVERFLLELGRGFAFVGRQYPLSVDGSDYYIDLLFYHLRLRRYVVIDLKKGEFKPEYAGKMNFYLGVIDEQLRHAADGHSLGLILCQDRNRIVAEYALRGMSKPIGVSEYDLTRALPKSLRSALPTIEQIETELSESAGSGSIKSNPVSTKRKSPRSRHE